jgi:hypothetical protein
VETKNAPPHTGAKRQLHGTTLIAGNPASQPSVIGDGPGRSSRPARKWLPPIPAKGLAPSPLSLRPSKAARFLIALRYFSIILAQYGSLSTEFPHISQFANEIFIFYA